ncbi:MAG: rod shape-determining protein MreD [Pseudomonadales bacterium]|nr:rod shape-determining protein MreD [Pseudomonadales bacterium]
MDAKTSGISIILFSLFIAFLLATIPLSNALNIWRPEWVLLVLLYWLIELPERMGLIWAWSIGILVDIVEGGLLGQHAITFVVVAFLAINFHQQFRMFSRTQQTLLVALTVAGYELIDGLIMQLSGSARLNFEFFLPVFFSALVWPLIFLLLQGSRRKYSVA